MYRSVWFSVLKLAFVPIGPCSHWHWFTTTLAKNTAGTTLSSTATTAGAGIYVRAPKQWSLGEFETITTLEAWCKTSLSLEPSSPFLWTTWTNKVTTNPTRGLAAGSLTTANYRPAVARNSFIKKLNFHRLSMEDDLYPSGPSALWSTFFVFIRPQKFSSIQISIPKIGFDGWRPLLRTV